MRRGNVDATALEGRKILGGSNLWLIKMPAINERCVSSQQLNRRDLNMIALADPFTRGAVGLLRHVIALGQARLISTLTRSQDAGALASCNAGRLCEIKFVQS